MRRYLRPSAFAVRYRLGDTTRAMMIRPILTICAAMTAVAAATSLVQAQQSYPVQQQAYPAPGQAYSPYPPNGPADYRRGPNPNIDSAEDDEDPDAQVSSALPT